MDRKLKVGDVIHLSKGTVNVDVEKRFLDEYLPFSDEITNGAIEINDHICIDTREKKECLKNDLPCDIEFIFYRHGIVVDKEKAIQLVEDTLNKYDEEYTFDSSYLIGDYVVIEVQEYNHVYCKQLSDGKYNEYGVVINFYQHDYYFPKIMENELELIKEMKLCFI